MPDLPPLPAPTIEASDSGTQVKRGKTSKSAGQAHKPKGKMRVPSEQIGRYVRRQLPFRSLSEIIYTSNLCAKRWLKQVKPTGTKEEFEAYWEALTKEQQMVSPLCFTNSDNKSLI